MDRHFDYKLISLFKISILLPVLTLFAFKVEIFNFRNFEDIWKIIFAIC